ncbi:MAG: MFS transporter [Gammaproteobacteria bacterium]|nr:MFS transporter [Gammaproteobacteria bacterium]MCP5198901.1 MFS transporter [Gammaproteobacteria bacterium]
MNTQRGAASASQASPAYVWYVVGVCFLAYTVNFVDRQILAILLSPIKAELDLKDVHLGLLSGTAFGIFYATMGIPIGRLADRYPRRTVMAVCVALWSGMTALSGAARGFASLLACRVGVGVGEAGCSPPAISLISDSVPEEKRGRALSLYSMGVPVGIVIGFLAGGYLREIVGWRMAFLVVGAPGLLVAALLLFTVREPPRRRHTALPPVKDVFAFLWQRRSFRYLSLASGLYAFATYSTSFMIALFLERSHGLSPVEQGQAAAFIMAGGVGVGTFAGGFIADAWAKHDRRAYALLPMVSMAIAVPGSAAAFLCENTPLAIGLLMIPGLCGQIYQAPAFAASQFLAPPSMRVTAAAVLFFVINIIGLMCGPATTGWLSDHLRPTYGEESLRYALLAVNMVFYAAASFFYWMSSRSMREDFDHVAALPE